MQFLEKRIVGTRQFDLGERTFLFAQHVRSLVKKLPRTLSNIEDCKQLVRSSGSIAANYAEADEALSTKDFLLRLRICRKESKESIIHLKLLDMHGNAELDLEREKLASEANELVLIFASIIRKTS